jgi:hypothetical protein
LGPLCAGLCRFGPKWFFLVFFVPFCAALVFFVPFWFFLCRFGFFCAVLVFFVPFCAVLVFFVPFWFFLCSFVPLWGKLGVKWFFLCRFGEKSLQSSPKDLLIPYYIFSRNTVTHKTLLEQGETRNSLFAGSSKSSKSSKVQQS